MIDLNEEYWTWREECALRKGDHDRDAEIDRDTMKDYLLRLLEQCAPDNGFAQDAIEYAVVMGWVTLTENLIADVQTVMGQYDTLLTRYRSALNQNVTVLADSYQPLLNQLAA
jgi:Flp pilus assembly pilin Flp